MSQLSVALAALGLLGCNAMFGIEEGYLQEPETAPAQTEGETAGALQPGQQTAGALQPNQQTAGAAQPNSATPNSAPMSSTPPPAPVVPPVLSEPFAFANWRIVPGNALGIYGNVLPSWGSGATIEPNCGNSTCAAEQPPDGFCVKGHLDPPAILPNGERDYMNYWGAQVVLALRGPDSVGEVWNRAGGRALGVTFQVEGPEVPQLRVHATLPPLPGEPFPIYCTDLAGDGRSEVRFDALVKNCWERRGTPRLEPTELMQNIIWNIPTLDAAIDFDFCVRQIQLILSPE